MIKAQSHKIYYSFGRNGYPGIGETFKWPTKARHISSNGIIYFVGLGFDHATDPNAVSIARYDLATQSFIDLTELNAVKGIAQPTATDFSKLTVEPNDPSGNTLYLTWDRYFQGSYFTGNPHVLSDRGKLYFSKSLDGATWSQPKATL